MNLRKIDRGIVWIAGRRFRASEYLGRDGSRLAVFFGPLGYNSDYGDVSFKHEIQQGRSRNRRRGWSNEGRYSTTPFGEQFYRENRAEITALCGGWN